jgi:hypothetical protein
MDFEFESVRTPEIVRWLYGLGVLGLFGIWLIIAIAGFVWFDFLGGLAGLLVVGPIVFGLNLALGRMLCEAILLGVRSADDLHAIRTGMQTLLAERDEA